MSGFGPGDVEAVRAVPGIATASALVTSTGFVESPHDDAQGEDGWPLVAISGEAAPAILGPAETGSLADLGGDTVALTADHAHALGTGVGGTIVMRLGDGAEADLRVVALLPAREDFEVIVLPVDLLATHTTDHLPSHILVRSGADANVGRMMASLRELARGRAGVEVGDRADLASAFAGDQDVKAWVNYVLVGVIVAYTSIALVNTLVIATRERWREFGAQRLVGSTRGQVMQMMVAEATIVAVAGIVLGTLASAATLIPFSLAMSGRLMPSGPIGIYVAIVCVVAGLTVVSTLVPAWLAMRPSPVEAAAD
jgi:putative ABC transport system permease protein